MTESEKIITLFTTRVRQLILQHTKLKKENEELYSMLDAQEKEIKQLKEQIAQAENDYRSLKTARMLEVCDRDIEESKKKISQMLRQVNKCITLLSTK